MKRIYTKQLFHYGHLTIVYKPPMSWVSKPKVFRCSVGKTADLLDFGKGQIVMARRIKMSISEMERLVGLFTRNRWDYSLKAVLRVWNRRSVSCPAIFSPRQFQSRADTIYLCSPWTKDNRAATRVKSSSATTVETKALSQQRVKCTFLRMGLHSRRTIHVSTRKGPESFLVGPHRNGRKSSVRRFTISSPSCRYRERICRFPLETIASRCTVWRIQTCINGIMVWTIISWAILGSIFLIV